MIRNRLNRQIYVLLLVQFTFLIFACKSIKKQSSSSSVYNCISVEENISSDEWKKFRSLYQTKQMSYIKRKNNLPSNQKLSEVQNHFLKISKESKSWELFERAINTLQGDKDRKKTARLLKRVFLEYPETFYVNQSKELSGLLTQMIKEDNNWKEPKDITQLSINEKINYHIYHLRDIASYQPGNASINSVFYTNKNEYNAALSLKEIGNPAIPFLIDLLDDRRPLCTIAYWRNFYPTKTVLRYQDAAIEILNGIAEKDFYLNKCTSCYFSNETCEIRRQKWSVIQEWYDKTNLE